MSVCVRWRDRSCCRADTLYEYAARSSGSEQEQQVTIGEMMYGRINRQTRAHKFIMINGRECARSRIY